MAERWKSANGYPVGKWYKTQRKNKINGKLSAEHEKRLNEIDFVWDPPQISKKN